MEPVQRVRTTRELYLDEGLSKHQLRRLCHDGELTRVRRGAYTDGHEPGELDQHRRLIAATVPLIGAESVLSHLSAAVVHGLPVPSSRLERVWVTRPGGGNGRKGPVLHLRRCRLEADEIVVIDGVAVTSLARTATDLARLLGLEWGVISADAVLRLGTERADLLSSADRVRGWPGGAKAMSAADFADARAESPLESVSRLQLHRLGYPAPTLQFPVLLQDAVVATADFGWEDEGLVGECDGKVKYDRLLRPGETASDAVMREKRREQRIRSAGFWISRWGWAEAWNPAVLRSIVDAGFEMAPRRAVRPRAS
jgi:hypothetical protein